MTDIRRKKPLRPIRATRSQAENFPFDISEWDLEAYDNLREIFEQTVTKACSEALECAVKNEEVICFLTDEPEYGMGIELPFSSDGSGPYWTTDLREVFYFDEIDYWEEQAPEVVEKWRDFFAQVAERLTKILNK